jgi:hypothetical protein
MVILLATRVIVVTFTLHIAVLVTTCPPWFGILKEWILPFSLTCAGTSSFNAHSI